MEANQDKFWRKLCLISLSLLVSASLWAQEITAPPKVEQPDELIKKAKKLILLRDRLQACQILSRSAKKWDYTSAEAKEIRESLNELSRIFFTEKAQQSFEFARSKSYSKWNEATESFLQAQKEEPKNLLVLEYLSYQYLHRGDCKKVLENADLALQMNPYDKTFYAIKAQALACLNLSQELQLLFTSITPDWNMNTMPAWILAKVQSFFQLKRYVEMEMAIEKLQELQPDFPETDYWRGLLYEKTNQDPHSTYKSYLEKCKLQNNELRQKYPWEPRVCLASSEVQEKIEK